MELAIENYSQVLQDGEFLRLGSNELCRVDVRVIAATHCDLEQAISERRVEKTCIIG